MIQCRYTDNTTTDNNRTRMSFHIHNPLFSQALMPLGH
jgi:hypothetical protein